MIVEPLEHGVNQIIVKVRDELRDHVGHQEPKIVSDKNASMLTRQLAIHTDVCNYFLKIKMFRSGLYLGSCFKRQLRNIRKYYSGGSTISMVCYNLPFKNIEVDLKLSNLLNKTFYNYVK